MKENLFISFHNIGRGIPGLYPRCVSMFRRRSSIPGQDLVSSRGEDKVEISGPNACASLVVFVSSTLVTENWK